jgi:hypothetical protein
VTIDECRDRIAVLLGWRRGEHGLERDSGMGVTTVALSHPVPTTIDGLAMLWPKGWVWNVDYTPDVPARAARVCCYAFRAPDGDPRVGSVAATEYEARLRLLLAVLEKEKADA